MAAAAAARRHYRGLTWLGRARRAGGAPENQRLSAIAETLAKTEIEVHCKCFDHIDYGDWKLQGICRENLHYLWKGAVRIAGKPCNSNSPFP